MELEQVLFKGALAMFDGGERDSGVDLTKLYIDVLQAGNIPHEEETFVRIARWVMSRGPSPQCLLLFCSFCFLTTSDCTLSYRCTVQTGSRSWQARSSGPLGPPRPTDTHDYIRFSPIVCGDWNGKMAAETISFPRQISFASRALHPDPCQVS